MEPRISRISAALLILLAAGSFVYWAYGALKTREVRQQIGSLVQDTSRALREALSAEAATASASNTETVLKLHGYSRAIEENLSALGDLQGWRDPAFAQAAGSYMLAAQQMIRLQAASHQQWMVLSRSNDLLQDHMRAAGRRTEEWIPEAVRRKRQLDRDYSAYRIAAEAFVRSLSDYPDAHQALARRIVAASLVEERLAAIAAQRVREAGTRVAAEMERARALAAAR